LNISESKNHQIHFFEKKFSFPGFKNLKKPSFGLVDSLTFFFSKKEKVENCAYIPKLVI